MGLEPNRTIFRSSEEDEADFGATIDSFHANVSPQGLAPEGSVVGWGAGVGGGLQIYEMSVYLSEIKVFVFL